MYIPGQFKGKKITVMGLGLLGRGIGDVKFLAEEGAELIVTDLKSKEELAQSIKALSEEKIGSSAKNITFILGEHRLEDFRNRDFILKAAGVPLDSPYIKEARKNNIPIEMSTSLFAALTPAMVIGITGTRGKSTVTYALHSLIFHALKQGKVFLGGNIKGVSTLSFLKETKEGDIAVLELDSWQLQGFGERKISPHGAIFTTFFLDHMNYYKNDEDAYFEDKANIFKFQTKEDFLVIGEQAQEIIEKKYGKKIEQEIKTKKIIAKSKDIPESWKLKLPGEHNRYNLALVLQAARALSIPDEITKDSLENFESIPGRLELVNVYKKIKIYNDTNSTTPQATVAALKALGDARNIVLIMGGADKNLDMDELLQEISKSVKAVILLEGSGSSRIEPELKKKCDDASIGYKKVASVQEAVDAACTIAQAGESILFSPAFASFGMFKNEYDRGEKFNESIQKLESK